MAERDNTIVTDSTKNSSPDYAREVAETANSLLEYALDGHRRGHKVYESLKNLNEVIGTQYGDRVLFELVQNGHDAHPADATGGCGEIVVRLLITKDDCGELLVANRGRAFSRSNLDAVINIGTSDKRIGEGIGNKGLGFRSVEALTDDVRIYSGRPGTTSGKFDGYCFRFASRGEIENDLLTLGATQDEARHVADTVPRYLVPKPEMPQSTAVEALAANGFATVVSLPLNSVEAIALAEAQVKALLDPATPVLLFLDRLEALDVEIVRFGQKVARQRSTRTATTIFEGAANTSSLAKVAVDGHDYLLARSVLAKPPLLDAIKASLQAAPPLKRWLDWQGEAIVSVAVPINGNGTAGRLFNFLPMTENAIAPIGGHIDAPFFADIDRRSMKPDVPFNKFLLEAAARTCALAATTIVDGGMDLPPSVVVDLAAWAAPHTDKLVAAFLEIERPLDEVVIWPVVAGGLSNWANFKALYAWPEVRVTQMTPKRLASVAEADIVLETLGSDRLARIRTVASAVKLPLDLSADALCIWSEAVARWLAREHRASPTRWKAFLDDVCAVFAASSQPLSSLRGRKIFVDADGKLLAATAKALDGAPPVFVRTKSGRRRRNEGPPSPPPSLKRKFRFLSDAIELSETTQRAFEKAGLLRSYDPLDVLATLKGTLSDKASDLQRQEALIWSFKVWNGGGGKAVEDALSAADLWVPTLGGWHPARTAVFSAAWTALGRTVEPYLLEAAPVSPDCAMVRGRLLIGFADWPRVGAGDRREDWHRFLALLGVSDGLPPLPAAVARRGTPSWHWKSILSTQSIENGFGSAWTAKVSGTRFENPYTEYELVGEIWRLPGQTEYAQLTADARVGLSELIVAFLREHGAKHLRFSIDHYRRLNRVELPTPLAVFLGAAPWVASVRGDDIVFAAPAESWSTTAARQLPPRFVPRFQSETGARAALPSILFDPRIGLRDWSNRETASARLAALAASLDDLNAAERRDLRDQLRRAWSDVVDTGQSLPTTLALVVERGGSLELCRPDADEPPLVHVTSERQGFAARALGDRGEAVLDVGENDAAAIATLIQATGAFRSRLADAGDVELIVDGQAFTPRTDDPLLATGSLTWLIDAAVLAHEYLGDPLELRTLPPDELERRLRQIRLRRCASFALMIDGELAHARGDERAQPVADPKLPTLVLVAPGTIGIDLLCEAAPALTKLMGVRRPTLETMLERLERAGFDGFGKPSEDQFARAIKRGPEVVRDYFAATRGGIERRVRALLPVVAHLADRESAEHLRELHERVGPALNLRAWLIELLGEKIAGGCLAAVDETDDQRIIRRSMGFDFAEYGMVLAALGYPPLNDEADFRRMFEVYLGELRPTLVDRVRRYFLAAWSAKSDLAAYVAARTLDFVTFDRDWLGNLETLTREAVAERADKAAQATLGTDNPKIILTPLDRVVADNRKLILARHAEFAGLVRTWCRKNGEAVPAVMETSDPQTIVRAFDEAGFLDFERIEANQLPELYRRIEAWPAEMKRTSDLGQLGLNQGDLESEANEAREAKRKAELAKRTIPFVGTDLDAGAADFARQFETLAALAINGADEWFARSRPPRLLGQQQREPGAASRGSGGGGQSWKNQPPDTVKSAMGMASEWLAREYLRRRYPNEMTDDCWVSSNRAAFCTGSLGDDSLGYDFRLLTERNEWLFEVKSAIDAGGEFELSPRELEVAGSASLERKRRYRILYVPFVFDPSQWRVLQLSNPAAASTRDRYRVVRSGSVRYRFEQRR